MGAVEGGIHPTGRRVVKALSLMLIDKPGIRSKQILPPADALRKPGEMVDAHDIDQDVLPGNVRLPQYLPAHAGQHFLRAEHLMTAAKRLDLWKYLV